MSESLGKRAWHSGHRLKGSEGIYTPESTNGWNPKFDAWCMCLLFCLGVFSGAKAVFSGKLKELNPIYQLGNKQKQHSCIPDGVVVFAKASNEKFPLLCPGPPPCTGTVPGRRKGNTLAPMWWPNAFPWKRWTGAVEGGATLPETNRQHRPLNSGWLADDSFPFGTWMVYFFRCGLLVSGISGCVSSGVCLVLRRHRLDSM